MNLYTVRFFAKAIKFGSKYVYQTVPRLLTIWLDLGENGTLAGGDLFKKLNEAVAKAIKETPVYKVRAMSPTGLTVSDFSLSVVHRLPSDRVASGPRQ